MVYNEVLKREIPEGWEVGTLRDICKIIRGADFPSLTGHSSCKAPIRFILNKNSSKILSSGDLVIKRIGA